MLKDFAVHKLQAFYQALLSLRTAGIHLENSYQFSLKACLLYKTIHPQMERLFFLPCTSLHTFFANTLIFFFYLFLINKIIIMHIGPFIHFRLVEGTIYMMNKVSFKSNCTNIGYNVSFLLESNPQSQMS